LGNEVLDFLSCGSWVSGEDMASRLGISRAAIWKQVKSLREKGFEIESSTRMGYRLAGNQDILDLDLLRSGLMTGYLGREIYLYREVDSTNNAARLIAQKCTDGTVILAEIQTAGRGRLDRPWSSPPGGVWMSLVLKPGIPLSLSRVYRINMAVSVALVRAISGLFGLPAEIKWPNDILINGRKICGILMEISAEVDRLEYALVGIGLNANVDVSCFPLDWNATSLLKELGQNISRVELIQRILLEIEATYSKMNSDEVFQEWCGASATIGKLVRIASPSGDREGTALALSEDGALCLKTENGTLRILAGDCIHLRALEPNTAEGV
jgi:BirA family transcriptional regulator, biotin operon repressor / biotin---[acetyl-CoA-carboxylase] ligase